MAEIKFGNVAGCMSILKDKIISKLNIFDLNIIQNSISVTIKTKQTLWPLVRKRTIPTERPPLVGEIYCQFWRIEGCRVVSAANLPRSLISVF
jgi:hypothetical protein